MSRTETLASVIRHLLRLSAVCWFLFCFVVTLVLTLTDHWMAYAVALTPLPGMLAPGSLIGLLLLLFVERRSTPWLAAALLLGLFLTPYSTGFWTTQFGVLRDHVGDSSELAIVTANAGKRDRQQLMDFVTSVCPDVIAVQAARLPADANLLAGWHYATVERLSLWSRWPIIGSEPIRDSERLVAARFDVAWPPARLAIYVMHFPSPREVLHPIVGGGFVESSSRQKAAEFQRKKWSAIQVLLDQIEDDSGPVLLVGDANQPPFGPAYRRFTAQLRDGHQATGGGFGYTLQSVIHHELWQPWIAWTRIDYILANRRLVFREYRTEPAHQGQHRALFARVRLIP